MPSFLMPTNRLSVGERLNFGDSLVSQNGQHLLIFQEDGNLVLYRNGRAEWHTDTANRPQSSGSAYAEVEPDGNFVVAHRFWGYRWESLTSDYGAQKPYLAIENDGTISIYDEEVPGHLWSSDGFPEEITGLFEEYTFTKRFLEKYRTDEARAKAANAKFQALRQWLEVLRITRGVSVKKILKRATWTQDHARDLGLITVVNRMQKIKDRINAEAEAIKTIRRLAPYRLEHLRSQQNGDSAALDEKQQLFKVVRGLIKERERRRIEQRKVWLSTGPGQSPGAKFGFEHDDEIDDDDDNDWCNGGQVNGYEKDEKVPEKFRHNIDFLLLTIHEVVEFESLTATAECNRALAWLFRFYIKGGYEPRYVTFDVDETDSINMWKRTSLSYWKFANEGVTAVITYGLSGDKDWFGDHLTKSISIAD